MGAHTLSLTACAWWLLCDMPSAQGRGHGVIRNPSRDRPLGRSRLFRRFCVHLVLTLEHLFLQRQNIEEKSAENLGKNLHKNLRIAYEKSACKNLRTKSAHKSARPYQRKNPIYRFRNLEKAVAASGTLFWGRPENVAISKSRKRCDL